MVYEERNTWVGLVVSAIAMTVYVIVVLQQAGDGPVTDVVWWRELHLPTRVVLQRDGRLQSEAPEWLADPAPYAALAGRTTFGAREAMVALLREAGDLDGEPRATQRMANFYEKGDKPL